jgi:hypothetical protein
MTMTMLVMMNHYRTNVEMKIFGSSIEYVPSSNKKILIKDEEKFLSILKLLLIDKCLLLFL